MAESINEAFDISLEIEQRCQLIIVYFELIMVLGTAFPVGGEDRETFGFEFCNFRPGFNMLWDPLDVQGGIGVCSACWMDCSSQDIPLEMWFVGDKGSV
jgi:hypothetical protein